MYSIVVESPFYEDATYELSSKDEALIKWCSEVQNSYYIHKNERLAFRVTAYQVFDSGSTLMWSWEI